MEATSLSNTNSAKIIELEDEIATSLRDAIAGREELEVATFSEDEVLRLSAICARLAALIGIRDLTSWMEEDEGGKQSSAWDIVSALAERGRLGYKEEEMVSVSYPFLNLNLANTSIVGGPGIAAAYASYHLEGTETQSRRE